MNTALKMRIIEKFGQQWPFARRMGMPEDRLSRIIHGRRTATEKEKGDMARVLGVKVQELFRVEGNGQKGAS
jgi:plasmid maintenance system antidote protein VapI